MTRQEAIGVLRDHSDAIRSMGATALYLFGSVARNDAATESDLDLFIDYDERSRFSLLELVGMKQFLEERTGTPVDLTTRDSLHPLLKRRIEESAVRIF